jgi:hypothetical protein
LVMIGYRYDCENCESARPEEFVTCIGFPREQCIFSNYQRVSFSHPICGLVLAYPFCKTLDAMERYSTWRDASIGIIPFVVRPEPASMSNIHSH